MSEATRYPCRVLCINSPQVAEVERRWREYCDGRRVPWESYVCPDGHWHVQPVLSA